MFVIPPTPEDPDGFTRNKARLDYILTSQSNSNTGPVVVTLKEVTLSDHLPLTTTIHPDLIEIPHTKMSKERVIKKGIKLKEIEQILLSPLWPTKPFIFIA